MTEFCPLSGGRMQMESLPEFCIKHCGSLWEDALKNQIPSLDDYDASTETCSHLPVVFSHESLQSVDGSSKRFYSIVDKCDDCDVELQENSYPFTCPMN